MTNRKDRRKKPKATSNRQKPRSSPIRDLESPEAAVARAFLTRTFIPSRKRIDVRADDARKFEQWRVKPSHPEPGSPSKLDDTDFFSELITDYVSESPVLHHALFPAMAAAENLTTVVRLIDDWDSTGQMRTMSDITLCRSALESSARTVWLLSPIERDERRSRALRMTKAEVLEQKKFLVKQVAAYEGGDKPKYLETLKADLAKAKEILDELEGVPGTPLNEQIIELASAWVDETAVNPQHTPMAGMAKPLYSIASGFAYGYTWTTQHLRGATDLFNITADFLYASTSMVSAAVILYETQAAASEEISELCPPHLRPIAASFHERYAG